jgi:hypothetical protein
MCQGEASHAGCGQQRNARGQLDGQQLQAAAQGELSVAPLAGMNSSNLLARQRSCNLAA